jgi:tape measure domain-containing protein
MATAARAAIEITGQDKTGPAFKSVNDKFGGLSRQVAGVGSAFRALQGAFVVGLGASITRQALDAADAYANITARLKLASGSTQEFATAQREVFAISQRSGTALASTADLYGSLARNASALGASQADLLRVTETIGKSFQISGTSAGAASAAITQLGQAFASGVLRGDELNSVLEQSPRLARAIADGLGVPIGRLRELGKTGQLTAEQVFGALRQAGADIDREFAQLPSTVERATQQASNSVLRFVGVLDKITGASSALSSGIASSAVSLDGISGALQRGERDARGYLDALLQLARNAPGIQGALLLIRRALPDVPAEVGGPAPLSLPPSLNDPRAGRSYVDPAEKALQAARLDFLSKFATRQEKLNATVAEYRQLLGRNFTADDEQRIRDAFKVGGTPRGPAREIGSALTSPANEQLVNFLRSEKSAYDDLADSVGRDLPVAVQTAEQEMRQAFLRSEKAFYDVDTASQTLNTSLEKNSTLAQDLGFTFSSAFEDAIVSGRRFSDVLKSIGQDILRILLRQNITGPLSAAIGSFDFSSILPSFAVGTPYVPRDMVAQIHKGERIVTAEDNRRGAMGTPVQVNVKVETQPGQTAEVQQRQTAGGVDVLVRMVRQVLRDDVNAKGPISRDFAGVFGLNRAAGAARRG